MHGIVEKIGVGDRLIADKRTPNRDRDLVLGFPALGFRFLGGSDRASGGKKHQGRSEKVPHLSSNSKHALKSSLA
jgi:hypothetical protein